MSNRKQVLLSKLSASARALMEEFCGDPEPGSHAYVTCSAETDPQLTSDVGTFIANGRAIMHSDSDAHFFISMNAWSVPPDGVCALMHTSMVVDGEETRATHIGDPGDGSWETPEECAQGDLSVAHFAMVHDVGLSVQHAGVGDVLGLPTRGGGSVKYLLILSLVFPRSMEGPSLPTGSAVFVVLERLRKLQDPVQWRQKLHLHVRGNE